MASASLLNAPKVPLGKFCRDLGVHISTAYRWNKPGVLTPSGERVRLPIVRIGKRPFVLESDAEAFVAARSDPDAGGRLAEVAADRRRTAASSELDALGL